MKNVKKNAILFGLFWYKVLMLVCYTAVFSVVTQRSSPQTVADNTETHSCLALNQLEFSSRFLEDVRATFALPIKALLLSVPHV